MTHIALYRTWRSQTFAEVVGQKHITQTLQNSLRDNRFTHAYLLSGPRGTGKTSTAKILAKALNCEKGPAEEPCNECSACRRMTEGALIDVVEIDAASNRGVDEIRDLRDKVKYAPTEVRYKVYIIDEVHMLTTEAFNALLKTLEEPPAHVIFILATTEPHRIPATILSRCQRFDFRRVPLAEQIGRLRYVCEQEQLEVEEDALHYIARLSDGGMRDALSLLDQASSFSLGSITLDDVLAMTGGLPTEGFERVLKAVHTQNIGEALQLIDGFMQAGKSADKCTEGLMNFIRDLLLLRMIPDSSALTERVFDGERLRGIATQFAPDHLMQMVETLNHYHGEMKYSVQPQTLLEIAVLRMCAAEGTAQPVASPSGSQPASSPPTGGEDAGALAGRVQRLEEQLQQLLQNGGAALGAGTSSGAPASRAPGRRAPSGSGGAASSARSRAQIERFVSGGDEAALRAAASKWGQILSVVKERKITVHAWLVDGEPVAYHGDALLVVFRSVMHRDTTEKPDNKLMIEQAMSEVLGEKVTLVTAMTKDWTDAKSSAAPPAEEMKLEQQDEPGVNKGEPDHVSEALKLFGEDLVTIKDE
ncbi:DNA polymerase III subunit gamma/tau [Paenibacillus sp. N1-5-1-14]|uniref:DNA polymerase III subunit gamma/tau n=1 Tax=Paenibacillus radicibacter TaxID=2972488 RepID=UPI0021592B16|nr:DNA polymerase III subunit gamma/tau [Paenibacillus radicibacter]MCR8642558.1 DNA polymerase III subunit gamma/tau [Paenibacillus radicibacter]